MKPLTWQPATIQLDSERQWAETVFCLIKAFHRGDAGQDPEENGHLPLRDQRYSICLLFSLAVGSKLFAGVSLFTCIFQS